jgi:Coenzyme PQQ synthesis protein D (PqqD)
MSALGTCPLGPERVVARSSTTLWRRCLDGVLVLPEGAAQPLLLTPPGDAIWELVAMPCELGDLLTELRRRFDGPAEEIASDTDDFIRDAIAAGAIEASEAR